MSYTILKLTQGPSSVPSLRSSVLLQQLLLFIATTQLDASTMNEAKLRSRTLFIVWVNFTHPLAA